MDNENLQISAQSDFQPSNIKFGTDGWRGIIGDTFTVSNVRLVTHAIARTFSTSKNHKHKVFIGYDHRFQAEFFAKEVAKILSKYNFIPLIIPYAVTSPFLSFSTWDQKCPFGIMITASHNPPAYLGLKIKGAFGGSIAASIVTKIEQNLSLEIPVENRNLTLSKRIRQLNNNKLQDHKLDLMTDYFKYLKRNIDFSIFKSSRFSACIDPLYGSSLEMAKELSSHIGSNKLTILHNKKDPMFGGINPEPIEKYLGDLKQSVQSTKSIVGMAFDGDGDRLGIIDEHSEYITPQQVFALLLYYLAAEKKLRGSVVQSVSMGYLSERIAKDFNLTLTEVPVGFKNVAERMVNDNALFGAEESGGFAFGRTKLSLPQGSVMPERDGLFSGLLFVEMLLKNKKSCSQLLKELQKKYGVSSFLRKDIQLDKPIEDRARFIQKIQNQATEKYLGMRIREQKTLDGLKIIMEDGSWLLIRPSGTEPLIRTYAEFSNIDLTRKSLDKLCKLLYNVQNKRA